MLTIKKVKSTVEDTLSKYISTKNTKKHKVKNKENYYDAKSVYLQLKLTDDLNKLELIIPRILDSIIVDGLNTTYVDKKDIDNDDLHMRIIANSGWNHYHINKGLVVMYKVHPMIKTKGKYDVTPAMIEKFNNNEDIPAEDFKIINVKDELEGINVQFMVIHKKEVE